MGLSIIQEQHHAIIEEIKKITQGDWKCLIVDEHSKKILDNVVKEDDILNNNIATIERIEERREMNPDMDAIYLLTPEPHIVDCLIADFERRRYRGGYLLWTTLVEPNLRRRLDDFPGIRTMRKGQRTLFLDFYPRESHLVTFRDPWSFPLLYHPACNELVPKHMQAMAKKIAGVCITLGEYPKVRYFRPAGAIHEAAVLCSHLARFVQEELDAFAQWNSNFPPPSQRAQAVLLITDRSMDLMAPLVHEFSYQAMAHDLLPIKEGEKITYKTTVNAGTEQAEEKDAELSEKDKVWTDMRHRHMKDTIDKLMGDFQKFIDQNPHFTNEEADTTSLNAIRDMLAGLPQFQEMKEAYSLHLTLAQECMNIFQKNKLPDISSVEQTLSTGLDEDFKKPKNVLDSVVRLLDDEAVTPSDRLRLIIMFALYRDGIVTEDIKRLLAHASLPQPDGEVLANIENLGGRTTRVNLKDVRQPPLPLFPKDPKAAQTSEEYGLSRFEPILKHVLDALTRGTLDQTMFPYVKPPMDPNEDILVAQGGSLRAGRPNWASSGRRPPENRQRLIVFVAGGATYSESRSCYEVGNDRSRDIVLTTSHMLTPQLFIRQVRDLSRDRRTLDLPIERPKPRAPAHLFERPSPPQQHPPPQANAQRKPGPPQGGLPSRPTPPTQAMGAMSINSNNTSPRPPQPPAPPAPPSQYKPASSANGSSMDGKLHKEKKKRNFLGMKK